MDKSINQVAANVVLCRILLERCTP